ncbi:hypothetical protein NP233_g5722 [Leucocoprinus birnbaumii]|uniref:MYND-type domain-containing protein n=1 Tax=Leucocoprinus birnbaumii TaxID=56174 RepID=A0AAD5VSB5_9AGAR|nr:hypothetical protein NP233_g5722 [Leucocoprinus birnbaumii]
MIQRECSRCKRTDPPPKQCAACERAFYCSSKCQRRDWVAHIFDCKPKRTLNSADYLAYSVLERGRQPEYPEAESHFGFGNSTDKGAAKRLVGLYTMLLHPDQLGVKPIALNRWRVEGTLKENIKREFQKLPEDKRGPDFAWFLKNSNVVDELPLQKKLEMFESPIEKSIRKTCESVGMPPTLTQAEMQGYINSMPPDENECLMMLTFLNMHAAPDISSTIWVKFGYSVFGKHNEAPLAGMYFNLTRRCTFKEFCAAYALGSLVKLFTQYGIEVDNPGLVDLLSETPEVKKSVWWLRQYIDIVLVNGFESEMEFKPGQPACGDYGFARVKTVEEHRMLVDLYKGFFANMTGTQPLEMHTACRKNRLFEFFTEEMSYKLKNKKVYKRLLLNSCPR